MWLAGIPIQKIQLRRTGAGEETHGGAHLGSVLYQARAKAGSDTGTVPQITREHRNRQHSKRVQVENARSARLASVPFQARTKAGSDTDLIRVFQTLIPLLRVFLSAEEYVLLPSELAL